MIRIGALAFCLFVCLFYQLASLGGALEDKTPAMLKPVGSTDSGLLLQEPLDLSKFTRQDFMTATSTVGVDRIGKKWTSAILPLPPPPGREAHALTEQEAKDYMLRMKDLFNQGKAVPVSDVGLISTHEDVIRNPMLNHVSAFANSDVAAYLLVQKTADSPNWGYFAIVQDRTSDPAVDYFADITGPQVKLEGQTCYKCHSSGPLALHPAREDLVNDVPLLLEINKHIADQPPSRFHFPEEDKPGDNGTALKLKACTECHGSDAIRAGLFGVHAYPIRMLVDFGYMPPERRLTPRELTELKSWLDQKH